MKNLIRKLFNRNTKNSITFENMTVKKFAVLHIELENVIYESSNDEHIQIAENLLK